MKPGGWKRAFDLVGASAALLVTAPLMVGISAAIAARMGRPVVFSQQRPGRGGRPFSIHKFRTMTDARGPDGALLPDEERNTRLGQFLRSTSLDELPELFDVLRGDMSLVGPRPLLMSYLEHYSPEQARRHEVKPGITGLAQVRGRNTVSWEERFALDVWYVDHWTIALDLRILAETVLAVLRREGVSHTTSELAARFRGNEPAKKESP